MFTPIKNLITYIQKNASGGSSIFGGSNASVSSSDAKKTETENLKPQSNNCIILPKTKEKQMEEVHDALSSTRAISCTMSSQSITNSLLSNSKVMSAAQATSSETRVSQTKEQTPDAMATTKVTDNSIVLDDDDIEAQLDTSIMLKKPVKRTRNNSTEILEVRKSPQSAGRSILISHDYTRNHVVSSPFDDELNDFQHDPTEAGSSSSPLHSLYGADEDEFYLEDGDMSPCEFLPEDAECVPVTECFKDCEGGDEANCLVEDQSDNEFINDSEHVVKASKKYRLECETELSECEIEEVQENEVEETFMELNKFPDCEVIVIGDSDVDLRRASNLLDTSTSDDPLAIACEEHEAFAADRSAALEELNLLNSSNNSQDEDTQTTEGDDLQWLRVDTSIENDTSLHDEQPSCSKSSVINNLASNDTTPEKEERNGEGSDSGLGSESSALHITGASLSDTSQLNLTVPDTTPRAYTQQNTTKSNCCGKDKALLSSINQGAKNKSPLKASPKPLKSNLKRRLEVDEDDVDSLSKMSSSATSGSLIENSASSLSGSVQKKPKRSINFDSVQVFYFPRQQGFGCVPSAGGCTLGMGARHVAFKTLTLTEHAAELRRAHRMHLQEINPRGSSSDDSEESEEDYLSEGSGSDLDEESNGFLQPVSPKQRRAILKAAGVRKIDVSEKADCRDIRNSREVCGCSCRDFCDPETCACSQSGIKCQVDRDMFPCGCSRDACGNTIGRVEFNPARVRTHFIHTLMRLEMENRQQQNPYSSAVVMSSAATSATSFYQSTHLQPQSNYSSGYASPAYNTSSVADMHPQTAVSNSFYHQQTSPIGVGGLYGAGVVSSISSPPIIANTAPYGMPDSLDSGLFGNGGAGAGPSYGELMPLPSYHPNISYGNVTPPQVHTYNSYHTTNTPYMNDTDATTTIIDTPTTYSSCAVPSLPPYGTATTTEATGDYHCVDNLRTMGTAAAVPTCSTIATELLNEGGDNGGNSDSFISLSTPLASSSRLSQINDLLLHNRNATTALVAVSPSVLGIQEAPKPSINDNLNLSYCNTINPIANVNTKSKAAAIPIEVRQCLTYEDLTSSPPLAAIVAEVETTDEITQPLAPIMVVVDDIADNDPVKSQTTSPLQQQLPEKQQTTTDLLTIPNTSISVALKPTNSGATTLPIADILSSSVTPTPTASAVISTTSSINSELFSEPLTQTMSLCAPIASSEQAVETATAPTMPVATDLSVIEVAAGN